MAGSVLFLLLTLIYAKYMKGQPARRERKTALALADAKLAGYEEANVPTA